MNDTSAFPHTNHYGHKITGMTLRDYFAAKAMQGMFINQTIHSATMLLAKQMNMPEENALAKLSYEVADAMMKAREA